jgi:hypothetical protein
MARQRQQRSATMRAARRLLHIFAFSYPANFGFTRKETVLIRSRSEQRTVIPEACARVRSIASEPFATSIRSVLAPRPTPALDRIRQRHTAFGAILALLTGPGGYRPSIRRDLMGRDGPTLARACDMHQSQWGDSRRVLI